MKEDLMSQTNRQEEVYRALMRGLEPGDVLSSLWGMPHQKCMVVLAKTRDGRFVFSSPAVRLNLVEHPQGPFQWSDEYNTFLMPDGKSSLEAIDLNTTVSKGKGVTYARLYDTVATFLYGLELPSPETIDRLLKADGDMTLALEAIINNSWNEALDERLVAAFAYALGRKPSLEVLAFLIASASTGLQLARGGTRLQARSSEPFQ